MRRLQVERVAFGLIDKRQPLIVFAQPRDIFEERRERAFVEMLRVTARYSERINTCVTMV